MKYSFFTRINIEKDEQKLFSKLLDNGNDFKDNWANRNHPSASENKIFETYFAKLDDKDIKGLVELYKPDFMMFNYTFSFRNVTYI